ncbi:alpha/beta fold hydrolase [Actinoallomurus purpureus]|uniref:alpha/beta fold hydrolase n=1 Tax=Actinoallomurus purpureus TaxID=478114 RepID=UPI002092257C|nr:alpha/beta fold hydrolase [Actinoallomurus purpureus]MCO6004459.1 alpha/beta fold hydrolase [Actinoallomurus purpureus]
MMRGRWAAIVGAMAVPAVGITWALLPGEPRVRASEQRIAVVDGPRDDRHVGLDTTFFAPAGGGRAPAVLLAHGFGGSKDDTRAEAERLARHGYAVLTWSARGFGRSEGEITLDSPDYDVKDVRQLIDWLARRPEVRLDGPGDPRVGVAGQSYGGGISLLAAAYDRRVDAIAPQITWYDLAGSLFPDATGRGAANGVFKKVWAGVFFTGGASSTACGRFLPSLCAMYQKVAETGRPTPEAIATLRRSSPSSVAGRIHVPTLLVQGQSDSLFPLDQADGNARAVTGAPVKVVWFQGGHDGGDPETSRIHGLVTGWFDHYLKDGPARASSGPTQGAGGSAQAPGGSTQASGASAQAPGGSTQASGASAQASNGFTVTRTGGIDSSTQRVVVTAATARRYSGLSGTARRALPLDGQEQTIQNPAGGSPASISTLPGLGALGGVSGFGTGGAQLDMPGQSAAFDTEPLGAPVQLTGSARVRVRVAGGLATLFAKVYDVGPDGQAEPARRLVAPLNVAGAADVALPAMDHRFDTGHRIRVVFSTTDMGFASPARPASYRVSVDGPLTVPVDPALRTPATPLPWWVWGFPAIAGTAAVALVATGRGRRRRGGERGDAAVPLEISGLTKRYKNGHLAVDDLSFRVEPGQVCGLLGPNGAGKTTTLRMLMGLIHPDAGQIRIFGEPVRPGAPVLARLGSFVEGPGFLPHLSGRDNLELYWKAAGRGEAHMDEALRIAGLGDAIRRPVRTYSQGMRQRLAIAQAMLGLPDLLVLDEPTNGLDPPQIAEMREVLVRYAAEGRTVIISSHLLAEVEQTCTDVVVMHRGTLVAAGPVSEIAGHDGSILIGTSEVDRAMSVLTTLEGVHAVEPYAPGVLVRLDGSAPSVVVAALVTAGVPVDRVTPHRRLEDAFLTLIGEGS